MDGLIAYILAKKYTDEHGGGGGGTTTHPLTFGSKTFNGSSAQEITAADLGLTNVFKIKGTKSTASELPTTGNTIGDIWFVADESVGYVWIEDESAVERWEKLGPIIDIVTAISASSTDTQIPSAKAVNTFVESKTSNSSNVLTSRGEQLVVNGSAFLNNNTNFSKLTFDGTQAHDSNGSFTSDGLNLHITSDYSFPLDPSQTYKISLDAKSSDHTASMYSMIKFYDADGYDIQAANHMYVAGSLTTLTQDLKNGDTEIHFNDLSGWKTTGADRDRIIFWDYVNSLGYQYPAETYSRHSYSDRFDVSGIDIANNTITLLSPWPHGTFVAGTKVSQGNTGPAFKYQGLSSTRPETTWTHYTGEYKGTDYSGTNVNNMLPPGTAFGKIGFIWNNNRSATDKVWVTNISVSANATNKDLSNYADKSWVIEQINSAIANAIGGSY